MYNPEYFGYDNATSADLIPQVGNVRVNTEQLDHDYPWYRQALQNNTPKNFTAYQIFKKYLFQPAFNDGRAIVEERLGRNLTGPEKLRFIASISADVWNTEVSRLLNPQGALTQKKTSKKLNAVPKVRHESWILLEVWLMKFKDNVNTGAYDSLVQHVVDAIGGAVGVHTGLFDGIGPLNAGKFLPAEEDFTD